MRLSSRNQQKSSYVAKRRFATALRYMAIIVTSIIVFGITAIFLVTNYPYKDSNTDITYINLPAQGENFETYSLLSHAIGRTYVHPKVSKAVMEAYDRLAHTKPELFFVYGETGSKNGGRFFPHRTHRDGCSVDFMTPMRELATGKPARLPTNLFTVWGYGIRLDPTVASRDMKIDLAAMCLHLAALDRAAKTNGLSIELVIIDPPILAALRTAPEYAAIRHLPFMQGKAWFPHDGHYHVDFALQ